MKVRCVFCCEDHDEPTGGSHWAQTGKVIHMSGWYVCSRHRTMEIASKFAGRCKCCGQTVIPGEMVLLVQREDGAVSRKTGRPSWEVFHAAGTCTGGDPASRVVPVCGPGSKASAHSSARGAVTKRDVAYATLYLLPEAPPEVVKAAYRALAQIYHPDRGGDPAKMAAVNAAVKEIG